MLGIGNYLWRLLPGNPILLRVVESSGRRYRDLIVRCSYLGLLVVVVCFSLLTDVGDGSGGALSLSALSRASVTMFRHISYLQLGLVALLAPIFTAGAITQEKDSQTYDILLSTPLTNGQIVLGSLGSRLFFVIALLVSGIPVFAVTQIFGGVAMSRIALSFGIAAATATVTGALAMAIATFKVGTRRTIFSFYLYIVTYLVGLPLLDQLSFFHRAGHDAAGAPIVLHTSWLTGVNPYLALRTLLEPTYMAPLPGQLPPELRTWPIGLYLTEPAVFYVEAMFLVSLLAVTPSILLLRRMAQASGHSSSWLHRLFGPESPLGRLWPGAASLVPSEHRRLRSVWQNPIAWREARTHVSAARSWVLRWGFVLAGLGAAGTLLVLMILPAARPAQWLDAGSYDPVHATVFINGENRTFGVNEHTSVEVDGQPAALRVLGDAHALIEPPVAAEALGPGGKLMLDSIKLTRMPTLITPDLARQALLGLALLELTITLLVVTNAAASAVTREREDGSLDLTLTTPITSRYYIWGKLRGLVSLVLPMLAVPVLSAGMFAVYDVVQLIASAGHDTEWTIGPQAVIVMPATLVVVTAFAAILGMQMSLICRTTVRAVMSSLGIVLGVCGALGLCGVYASGLAGRAAGNTTLPGLAIAGISPFTTLALLLDPNAFGIPDSTDMTPTMARWTVFVACLIFAGVYAGVVWAMYRSMVRNFDITIRKQST